MPNRLFSGLIAATCVMLLMGCTNNGVVIPQSPPVISPLGSPLSQPSVVLPVVTADATKGQVVGVLQVKSGNASAPVARVNLYLAPIIKNSAGEDAAAGFDRLSSPRAIADAQGHFTFYNVSPGRYGLVLDLIMQSYLLGKPDDGKSLIISVAAGEQADYGTLTYTDLPVTPNP